MIFCLFCLGYLCCDIKWSQVAMFSWRWERAAPSHQMFSVCIGHWCLLKWKNGNIKKCGAFNLLLGRQPPNSSLICNRTGSRGGRFISKWISSLKSHSNQLIIKIQACISTYLPKPVFSCVAKADGLPRNIIFTSAGDYPIKCYTWLNAGKSV